MRRTGVLRASIFFGLVITGCAQVRGPVIGYLPEGGALRTIYGIPAAGSVGNPLPTDRLLSGVAMSPDQSRALALTADTGAVMLLAPGSGSTVHVNGAASGADRIVFSPSGTAAALWFSSARHLQVISGLATIPSVRDVDASFLGADPTGLAVSDDGQWAVGAWSDSVYAFGPDSQVITLPVQGPAEALCFFHGRADVAVITTTQVIIITGIGGTAVPNVIWTKPDTPADPNAPPAEVAVGFAVSFDNSLLSIAGNLGHVFTFDLTTGATVSGDCGCSPTGLFGMGGSLFRLTGLTGGALKLYDASTNDVWFVPLAAPITSGSGGAR